MDRELGGRRVVAADEIDLAVHQHRNEREVRLSRLSLAITSLALCFLQAASAFSNSGRSLRLPLSISVNASGKLTIEGC
jgi:hypothetical protein